MICIKCNAIIAAGSKQCSHCGQVYEIPAPPPEVVRTNLGPEDPAGKPMPPDLDDLFNRNKTE